MARQIINYIISTPVTLVLIGIAVLTFIFTIISIIKPSRVKVRKRIIEQDSKFSMLAQKVINKITILARMKETISIQLGLVTAKSDIKNDLYASVIVISILGFFSATLVLVAFLDIPILFKPLVLVSCVVIPYAIVTMIIRKKRKKIYNDFPELVSVFIAKYASTRNIKESLRKSIPDLPYTLRHEVKRLVNSMNHADNYFKTLDQFDIRVNYIMCTAFVALLKAGYKTNHDIIQSLLDLESYISQERLEEHRKVEQLKDKKANLYFLMIAMVGAYFGIVNRLGEKAINFYWHTIQGQLILAGCVIFSILTIVVIMLEESL